MTMIFGVRRLKKGKKALRFCRSAEGFGQKSGSGAIIFAHFLPPVRFDG